ncbi:ABC transporter ATP-binding protein [Nocardia mangyaensis]|uniref:ABC transporter ATP-binding protein n=1 Tax=Nocardia mangyaensis TaxID=2213200 RepID=UPI002674B66B|nr:dipeptide/oligopeptide/nickel ABC transporter ATP-binding protein [Nocardia mangyaensis]MDO3645494.1 dipeptide/oligopeptide/nickel ABC transporter ATP-binding protein [Nocardia mangyaensis]
MLVAETLTVGHRPDRPIVRDVDLRVAPGEIIGITGESGSGKTTLARTLAGLLTPTAGRVTVDGKSPRQARGDIAMVFQSPRTATNPHFTLAQIIAEPARIRRTPYPDLTALAGTVGLTPDLLTRRPHALSDGQLQRACLARALAQNPRYLILDEPTAMLDAATTATIIHLVTSRATQNTGVVLISHDTPLLEVACTRIATVHAGALTPHEVSPR